ncbi:MAG: RNA polymerase sigma-70 factor [Tannerella sp.]|jgi:RNA polymerase sigma-70 factor (ECF subfamily)|nr:RNA polymerase sigma-70 factor [Tannerella sp.]
MEQPDIQWIEKLKNDDYTCYNQLFMYYYPKLCEFVNNIVDNGDDAEDIVQELFIKLWDNRKKILFQTTVSGYLYRTAKNMALNFIRDESNRRTILEKKWEEDRFLDESSYEDEDNEYENALEDCVEQLPTRCKEILMMHRVDGYKQKEIAEKLNISIQTIKNQIGNSLQRLRNCLQQKGIITKNCLS